MTMSTERASIMWRNGTMPQTYSPPAIGVFSAAVTRAKPAIVVAGGDVLQPEQADAFFLDAVPISIACSGRQRWLMSHISLMSGPIASRTTRTRRTSSAGVGLPGSAIWVFISRSPSAPGRAAVGLVVRQAAAQRARGIGRHAIATAAEKLPQRLVQRLALDVPQRDVDRRERQREDAAGPANRRARRAAWHDRLDRAAGPRRRRGPVHRPRCAGCGSARRHRA